MLSQDKTMLRELLSEIEHEQWIAWSKNIAETETITPGRLERWKVLWRPYSELTEAEKDQDREWADKILALLTTHETAVIEEIKKIIREASLLETDLPSTVLKYISDEISALQDNQDK